jgi:hypothetical protein
MVLFSCDNEEVLPNQDQKLTEAVEFKDFIGDYTATVITIDGETYNGQNDYCNNYQKSNIVAMYEFNIYQKDDELFWDKYWVCSNDDAGGGSIDITKNETPLIEFKLIHENNIEGNVDDAYVIEKTSNSITIRWHKNTSDARTVKYTKK